MVKVTGLGRAIQESGDATWKASRGRVALVSAAARHDPDAPVVREVLSEVIRVLEASDMERERPIRLRSEANLSVGGGMLERQIELTPATL